MAEETSLFIHSLCEYMCGHTCALKRDNEWELDISFQHTDFGNQIQVVKFSNTCCYQLHQLAGPEYYLKVIFLHLFYNLLQQLKNFPLVYISSKCILNYLTLAYIISMLSFPLCRGLSSFVVYLYFNL